MVLYGSPQTTYQGRINVMAQNTITLTYNGKVYKFPYQVIRRKRKTCAIAVNWEGDLLFRVPLHISDKQIQELAKEKTRWIIKHYEKAIAEKNKKPVSDLSDIQRALLEEQYKEAARSYIPKRTAYFQTLTGGSYQRISIRDQKTRWGSCSSKGTLSFNWRLMLAPPDILDYVIVHELCHLTHMDHSPEFWQAVEAVCPNYRNSKKWLKDHGKELVL